MLPLATSSSIATSYSTPPTRNFTTKLFGKDVGCLAQGLPGIIRGTDTMDFVEMKDIPLDQQKYITYARIV